MHCAYLLLQPSSRVVLSVTDRVFLNKPIASNRNELNKMFIISLGNSIELESTPRSQAVRTSEYGRLNQPITEHVVVPERSNEYNYVILCILEFRMNVRLQCIQENQASLQWRLRLLKIAKSITFLLGTIEKNHRPCSYPCCSCAHLRPVMRVSSHVHADFE